MGLESRSGEESHFGTPVSPPADTPRTNAFIEQRAKLGIADPFPGWQNFARQLERELTARSEKPAQEGYRKCFTALMTLLPMAKAAIPHPSCTVAYAASLAQADEAINTALHPEPQHADER